MSKGVNSLAVEVFPIGRYKHTTHTRTDKQDVHTHPLQLRHLHCIFMKQSKIKLRKRHKVNQNGSYGVNRKVRTSQKDKRNSFGK